MASLEQIREGEVPAGLAGTYRDIRHVLRIGYVPLLFRALAPVPGALKACWAALRPSAATRAFEEACDDLRAHLARTVTDLGTPLIEPVLAASGFDVDGLDELREQVLLFQYADPKVLALAAALDRALAGETAGGARVPASMLAELPMPTDLPELMLAPEHPGGVVGEVFSEILKTTHLPAVTTDLRALGHWPEALEAAWEAISPVFSHRNFEAALKDVRAATHATVARMPVAVRIPPEQFAHAQELGHVRHIVGQFVDAMPRLALFASALRVSLDGPQDARESPYPVDFEASELEPPP